MRKGIIKAFLIITLTILFPFSFFVNKAEAAIQSTGIGGEYGVPQLPGHEGSTLCIEPGVGGITNVESQGAVPQDEYYCPNKGYFPIDTSDKTVPNGEMYYEATGGGTLSPGLAFALSQGGSSAQLAAWGNLGAFGGSRWSKWIFCPNR